MKNKENNIILNIFRSFDLIRLLNLFTNIPLHYFIIIIKNIHFCYIYKTLISNHILKNRNFAKVFIKAINNYMHLYWSKLILSYQKQLVWQISNSILYLANTIYRSCIFKLSQFCKELPELSGFSVIVTIKNFTQNNIIVKENNNLFKILNKAKFENYRKNG